MTRNLEEKRTEPYERNDSKNERTEVKNNKSKFRDHQGENNIGDPFCVKLFEVRKTSLIHKQETWIMEDLYDPN